MPILVAVFLAVLVVIGRVTWFRSYLLLAAAGFFFETCGVLRGVATATWPAALGAGSLGRAGLVRTGRLLGEHAGDVAADGDELRDVLDLLGLGLVLPQLEELVARGSDLGLELVVSVDSFLRASVPVIAGPLLGRCQEKSLVLAGSDRDVPADHAAADGHLHRTRTRACLATVSDTPAISKSIVPGFTRAAQ